MRKDFYYIVSIVIGIIGLVISAFAAGLSI